MTLLLVKVLAVMSHGFCFVLIKHWVENLCYQHYLKTLLF